MANNIFIQLAEKYPFITLCVYATTEYVGIIQNQDDVITTIYDFPVVAKNTSLLPTTQKNFAIG